MTDRRPSRAGRTPTGYLLSMTQPRTAITIGNFDGVHLGHAALIDAARRAAGPDGRVVALAFDPHPRSVLRPGTEPDRLTTFARRTALLLARGADEVRRLEPDRQLLGLSAEAFIGHVVRAFNPQMFVEGPDFHFGNQRRGDTASLAQIGERHGFGVQAVGTVETPLDDHSSVRVSSTLVRWLLLHGRVRDAARLLGRPYELAGEVVRGDRRGRTGGFPTANIRVDTMRPKAGVYAAIATLPDGRCVPAAVNIGTRPTVNGSEDRVEAHVLGLPTSHGSGEVPAAWAPIEGLGEYGWTCRLGLVRWLRDEMKFGSFDVLMGQIGRDCVRAHAACQTASVVETGVPA